MALAFASLTAVETAVTAAAAGDAKGVAFANGIADAVSQGNQQEQRVYAQSKSCGRGAKG